MDGRNCSGQDRGNMVLKDVEKGKVYQSMGKKDAQMDLLSRAQTQGTVRYNKETYDSVR